MQVLGCGWRICLRCRLFSSGAGEVCLFGYLALWTKQGLFGRYWLLCPLALSSWSLVWTHLRHNQLAHHKLSDKGIRIAHLSDVHVSPVMRAVDVQLCFEKMLRQNPDLVLLTGDLLMPFSEQPEEHQYLIEQLSSLKLPTYACLGNEDLPVRDAFVQGQRQAFEF